MDSPARVLSAGRTEQRPISQFDRLVLDRTENAVGQFLRCGPSTSCVGGTKQHPPPAGRVWPHLVEKQQRSASRLEQNWVPTRKAIGVAGLSSVGNFDWGRPRFAIVARQSDPHVGILFGRFIELRCDQAVGNFGDSRGMAGGEGSFFEDKFTFDHRR